MNQLTKGSRSIWILLLLGLVASMTISSVLSTVESAGESAEFPADDWDEGFDDDYLTEEDTGEVASQEYNGSQQPPQGSYAQLHQAQHNYGPSQHAPQPQYHQAPAPHYPTPAAPHYQVPPPPPQQHYQPQYPVPAVESKYQQNYSMVEVVMPAPAAPVYQPQPQVYQAPTYEQPQQPSYQAPTYEQQQPQQPSYQQPQPQTYQQPQPQPQPQPQTYQQAQPPVPPPKPQSYQPQQAPTHQAPAPVYQSHPQQQHQQQQAYATPKPASSNYSAPAAKPSYAPVPVPAHHMKPATNYTQVVAHPQQYPQPQTKYSASSLAQKYSLTDLAPFTTPFGYRSNHWSLHYYRSLDHTVCPKQGNVYHVPTQKDIENAFASAIALLNGGYAPNNGHVQYLNMSTPTFAARHQIASYTGPKKNARMDEEGLLVEFVSIYLADRLCLTKWDRQRYLPSVTKFVSSGNFPSSHTCSQYHAQKPWQQQAKNCYAAKYRTYDGFCNNPYHQYWGKSDVCHIRLLSPDYADGIQAPREAHNQRYLLPNPRTVANTIHSDVPLEGPYNLMKMQWGQFINHDISNTALSAYDGLVDCCKSASARGCWPIRVMPGDRFYGPLNVTCLNFVRSGACPLCQLGPRQQTNKNTAFLDASHVYGNNHEQAVQLRAFVGGLLKTSSGRNGEHLLPVSNSPEQCFGACYKAGDTRVNQHPALTALHVVLLRNHNRHAQALAKRHPDWNDETLFQEARRLNIAEYQMITYGEYLPIVFGPILSAYYRLTPLYSGTTQYDPKVDPTTWNEYTTAACRFGHSQISSLFSLTTKLASYGQQQQQHGDESFRLKDWFFRPSLLADGKLPHLLTGLLGKPSLSVDPWITTDVRNYLYKSPKETHGGDLAATNIWRGRDHGLPGYVHYVEYCFNHKVRGWKDLALFIPPFTLNQLRRIYKVVENIDLFVGGLSERHFPGADIGPTFACINGIQYYHLKFGDRYYFEHGHQAGSFNQAQLDEIRRSSLAKLLCRSGHLPSVPQYAFLQPSHYNPVVNCSHVGEFNYNLF